MLNKNIKLYTLKKYFFEKTYNKYEFYNYLNNYIIS